jgi:hypothetical protein
MANALVLVIQRVPRSRRLRRSDSAIASHDSITAAFAPVPAARPGRPLHSSASFA